MHKNYLVDYDPRARDANGLAIFEMSASTSKTETSSLEFLAFSLVRDAVEAVESERK
jgi:hypothetical protein